MPSRHRALIKANLLHLGPKQMKTGVLFLRRRLCNAFCSLQILHSTGTEAMSFASWLGCLWGAEGSSEKIGPPKSHCGFWGMMPCKWTWRLSKASENVMTLKRGAGKIHDTFAMSICEDLWAWHAVEPDFCSQRWVNLEKVPFSHRCWYIPPPRRQKQLVSDLKNCPWKHHCADL